MDETHCPPPGSPNEAWDKCIRSSSWIISFGTILGAAGTVLLTATAPLLVGTGLGVAVSVNRCRNLLREQNKRNRDCPTEEGGYYGENKDKEDRGVRSSEDEREGTSPRSEDYTYDEEGRDGTSSRDEERVRKECCPIEESPQPPQHGQGDELKCICPPGTQEVTPNEEKKMSEEKQKEGPNEEKIKEGQKERYCIPIKEDLKCTCPPPPPPPIICTCPPPSTNICTCPPPSTVNKLNEQKMEGGKAEPCANKLNFSWPPLLTFSQVKTSEIPHNLDEDEPFCTCDE